MRESTAHRTVGRQLVSIALCQGSYSPVFCCTLIGRSCQFVSIGQDVSDIQAALQAARCHPQINRVGMDEAVLPSWIMFDIQQSRVHAFSSSTSEPCSYSNTFRILYLSFILHVSN